MKYVIFNYNLKEEAENIYKKLISDGVCEEDIILADNGSNKREFSGFTSFSVPKNIRFTGSAFLILNYLLNFDESEYYVFITTSGGLLKEINYNIEVKKAIKDIGNDFGFIASSLTGGNTEVLSPEQSKENMKFDYVGVYHFQPIFMILNRKLLKVCESAKASYFNLELKRGWGIDKELQFISNSNEIPCYVSKNLFIEWRTNVGYKKEKMDESLDEYQRKAKRELDDVFISKYGLDWNSKFEAAFAGAKYKKSYKKIIKSYILKIYWRYFGKFV